MYNAIVLIIVFTLALSGCGARPEGTAGLQPAVQSAAGAWQMLQYVDSQGQGNLCRVVARPGFLTSEGIELAAAADGKIEYFREIEAGPDVSARYRVQFLSTQGTGRIKIAALDEKNNVIATVGWVVTGPFPRQEQGEAWLDVRIGANYKGDWLTGDFDAAGLFAQHMPGSKAQNAAKYRLAVEAGEGQHALIAGLELVSEPHKVLKAKFNPAKEAVDIGSVVEINVDVTNTAKHALKAVKFELVEPYGYGLVIEGEKETVIDEILPGASKRLTWRVRAQRPDAVNLNVPWALRLYANGAPVPGEAAVSVRDTRPGKIFYVMTDDLEAIDSAGYPAAWGNRSGWLEPEEILVQMVYKAERLNAIAAQYGAKWTHYTAWPLINAARWAARQSSTGKWQQAVEAIENSVRRQTILGHEYGIHMHIDYDPDLPGNILSYNPELDGIWANHRKHGWAHSLAGEGDFTEFSSRAGTLYYYQRIMDELAASSPLGQLVTARAGSFDFGHGSEDEAKSVRVYRKLGLWGGSDADGNAGGITSADYGREIYFTRPDDINLPASDLKDLGIVEFRPTPGTFIAYDSQKADVLNQKTDHGVSYFTAGKEIKPGIHGIIGFTHAMFVMGEGDWKSLDGGQFAEIERHLRYVKERYAENGIVVFATASEMVKAYLDYYSPVPLAVYGPRIDQGYGISDFSIELLGRDIPWDEKGAYTVSVKYPLYLRDSAYRISVLKNGQPIYTTWNLPAQNNDIQFSVDDKSAKYTLRVYHNVIIHKIIVSARHLAAKFSSNPGK